jgi:hypothetical protein
MVKGLFGNLSPCHLPLIREDECAKRGGFAPLKSLPSFLLRRGAKHPSIRRYLADPIGDTYQGVNSPTYHTVLAEVIAEALAFYVLEKQFKRQGQGGMLDYTSVDAYYHRHFSDFLSIAHKNLGAGLLSI